MDYIRSVTLPMTFYFKIIPAGRQQSAILTIRFQNGKKLKIREEGDQTSNLPQPRPSNERVAYLNAIYESLRKKSLPFRLAKYLDEFQAKGSIIIEKSQFKKDRMIVHKNKAYRLDTCTISKAAHGIRIEPLSAIGTAGRRPCIEIVKHGDVTAELLKVLYGLECVAKSS